MAGKPIYCIDTSSVLEWFVRTYPPTIFPALPQRMQDLVSEGRLRAPKAVLDEIKPGDDCHKWSKGQKDLFIEEEPAVQQLVKNIMAVHYNPAKPLKGISGADPFVIALAKFKGPNWIVVTEEKAGSEEGRKMPFVCKSEGVDCIRFQAMMLQEGWKFR